MKAPPRGVLRGGEHTGTLPSFFAGLKTKNIDINVFILPKLQKMPFLAVYRSVRPTTHTNGVLMLRSCLWHVILE